MELTGLTVDSAVVGFLQKEELEEFSGSIWID